MKIFLILYSFLIFNAKSQNLSDAHHQIGGSTGLLSGIGLAYRYEDRNIYHVGGMLTLYQQSFFYNAGVEYLIHLNGQEASRLYLLMGMSHMNTHNFTQKCDETYTNCTSKGVWDPQYNLGIGIAYRYQFLSQVSASFELPLTMSISKTMSILPIPSLVVMYHLI